MNREITYHIDENEMTAGRLSTASEFLRRRGYSRHLVTWLRHHEGTLLVNGEPAFTNRPVRAGDVMTVTFTDDVPAVSIIPWHMDLDIVYEDEDILVINKPPYLPVQPSLGHREHTLGNAVVSYYQEQGLSFIYRCVNRLDRDTSGLVIIAKNMASSAVLYDEMKSRRIHRTYYTLVHGRPLAGIYRGCSSHEEGSSEESASVIESAGRNETKICGGTIDLPIARRAPSTIERCVDFERGQRAVTHFCELEYFKEQDVTALSVRLETGRTHQIRVHMSYIGHPVVGDFLYGVSPNDILPRQALHSWKLEFAHPITREQMQFTADIPEDMRL